MGDVFLAFALFILYNELGTLNFREMVELAPGTLRRRQQHAVVGNADAAGVVLWVKSASCRCGHGWPTRWRVQPLSSALIHAATPYWSPPVYLIARTHGLFLMTPEILHLVGIVGAVTLVLAGFAALVQTDIKRVLAYSTMSQIGYMFRLGVQAWTRRFST